MKEYAKLGHELSFKFLVISNLLVCLGINMCEVWWLILLTNLNRFGLNYKENSLTLL